MAHLTGNTGQGRNTAGDLIKIVVEAVGLWLG